MGRALTGVLLPVFHCSAGGRHSCRSRCRGRARRFPHLASSASAPKNPSAAHTYLLSFLLSISLPMLLLFRISLAFTRRLATPILSARGALADTFSPCSPSPLYSVFFCGNPARCWESNVVPAARTWGLEQVKYNYASWARAVKWERMHRQSDGTAQRPRWSSNILPAPSLRLALGRTPSG